MGMRIGGETAGWLETLCGDGALGALSDGRLIERFLKGDGQTSQAAFETLVRRHGPTVLGRCRAILRDPHEAEDAFQAVFVVLARRAETIRDCDCLAGWLNRVARRIALRARARSARRGRYEELHSDLHVEAPAAPELVAAERARLVRGEVDRLAPGERNLLHLTYWQGTSYAEAAARLDCPVGTVRSRLARARERLRGRLLRLGLAPGLAVAGWNLTARHARAVQPPEALVRRTLAAVKSHNDGYLSAAGAGVVSAEVAALVEGELATMQTLPWKAIAALLLAGGGVGGGIATVVVSAVGPPALAAATEEPAPPQQVAILQDAKQETKSLLANGGAEDGEGDLPSAWSRGRTVIGVDYLWSHDTAHSGKSSLCLKKTANAYFPIAEWQQQVARDGDVPRLKVSAWIKADKASKAILDVQFIDDSGQWSHAWAAYIGARKPNDPPVTHDWKRYEGVVTIPERTVRIIVAPQIYGPGSVWFDDLTAEYTKAPAKDPVGS